MSLSSVRPKRFKPGSTVIPYLPADIKNMITDYLPLGFDDNHCLRECWHLGCQLRFCSQCKRLADIPDSDGSYHCVFCNDCLRREHRRYNLRRWAKDRHPHSPIAYRVTTHIGAGKTITNTIYRE
jgi:hypothetical protein